MTTIEYIAVRTRCLACQVAIDVGPHPDLGQRVICPACNTAFDIVWLYPVHLDWLDDPQMFSPQAPPGK